MKNAFVTLVLIFLIFVGIFSIPLLVIWSLNNLFNLEAQYNWKSWVSVYVLLVILSSLSQSTKQEIKAKEFWWK
jgi:VanZ family protein